MQKIMLTGSNGFLGQKLLQAFLKAGEFDVLAVSKGPNRYTGTGVYQYQELDVCQPEALRDAVRNFCPQIILHTAAMAGVEACENQPQLAYAVNSDSVKHLVALCEEFDIKLIFLSTDFIFDGENGPYFENSLPNPVNVYGESKERGEQYILRSDISWAVIRTILVYGVPHDPARSNFVLWVKQNLEQKKSIKIATDHFRMPTLVEDVVDTCLTIIRKDIQGLYHVCGPELFNMLTLAYTVARFWNLDGSLIKPVLSSEISSNARRPPFSGFIVNKAKDGLDFAPRTFKEGLILMDQQLKGEDDS